MLADSLHRLPQLHPRPAASTTILPLVIPKCCLQASPGAGWTSLRTEWLPEATWALSPLVPVSELSSEVFNAQMQSPPPSLKAIPGSLLPSRGLAPAHLSSLTSCHPPHPPALGHPSQLPGPQWSSPSHSLRAPVCRGRDGNTPRAHGAPLGTDPGAHMCGAPGVVMTEVGGWLWGP